VINAMSPADVVSIVIDEDARSMDVAVKEENRGISRLQKMSHHFSSASSLFY
jgi:hypothetical protein